MKSLDFGSIQDVIIWAQKEGLGTHLDPDVLLVQKIIGNKRQETPFELLTYALKNQRFLFELVDCAKLEGGNPNEVLLRIPSPLTKQACL